jgi:hypothetical protein
MKKSVDNQLTINALYLCFKEEKRTQMDSLSLESRGDRIRTCDPLVPNQVRYQLRYAPFTRN